MHGSAVVAINGITVKILKMLLVLNSRSSLSQLMETLTEGHRVWFFNTDCRTTVFYLFGWTANGEAQGFLQITALVSMFFGSSCFHLHMHIEASFLVALLHSAVNGL